jgi:hypothetical protein
LLLQTHVDPDEPEAFPTSGGHCKVIIPPQLGTVQLFDGHCGSANEVTSSPFS